MNDTRVMSDEARLADLLGRLPGYTPEWAPVPGSAGMALLEVLARFRRQLDEGIAQMPDRAFLAGLDALGARLLPAGAARVPLVFELAADAPEDVTLPQGSQVAAPPAPAAPSVLEAAGASAASAAPVAAEPTVFTTERTITLARAQLVGLHSTQPGADRFADHSAELRSGFTPFKDLEPTEHALYLGHDQLFALGGEITLIIGITLTRPAPEPMALTWEYFTEAGWIPLKSPKEYDTTGGLTASGQVTLRLECGPDAKAATHAQRKSYWIRARLRTPLTPGMAALPLEINDLHVRAKFSKRELHADAAFYGFQKLDLGKAFQPFGAQPAVRDSFYLAADDVFRRAGARCEVEFELEASGRAATVTAPSPVLGFDYSSEDGWRGLGVTPTAVTLLPGSGTVRMAFVCPAAWDELEVNGQKKRWLRVTITGGDYGKPGRLVEDTTAPLKVRWDNGNLDPPVVKSLALSFEYLTDPEPLGHCLALNEFVFSDHSEDCIWPDRSFTPWRAMADPAPALHLAFDRAWPVGLVSLYAEVEDDLADRPAASPYVWEYFGAAGWAELGVLDETLGLQRSGMLQFIGPPDAVEADGLGGPRYRLRARLKAGEPPISARVRGLWRNAAWARHERRIDRELLGTSDGVPGQSYAFARAPVLEGEVVEVREWSGRGEAWCSVLAGVPEGDIRLERDPASGQATAAWVRWRERAHLHASGAQDRHYEIERSGGRLRFGLAGPAAGRRIVASYTVGGGAAGNVATGRASELRVAAPHVVKVFNPVPAAGGAAGEAPGVVHRRLAETLRHRGRAVSASDIEWIARDASPEVARCRCQPLRGPAGRAQRGFVHLAVLPWSLEAQPWPSAELLRRTQAHVAARALPALRLRLSGPSYLPVGVVCAFVPIEPAEAACVEARVRAALDRFLHPLVGGPTGGGWGFGESLHLSQIAGLIGGVGGVDFVRGLALEHAGSRMGDRIDVAPDQLIAAGRHALTVMLESC